ncbi:MAG: hypothetical protein M1832_002182 [Thelocarpon impressellum]|nr:MAG: hypothetical protein M1832_002182 [Thelocarpon impressellum]
MLLATPRSLLVAAAVGLVAGTPLPVPDKWDAQEGSYARCGFVQLSAVRFEPAQLDFHVRMRGFGSRRNRPGQDLLDSLRSAKRGSLHVETWESQFETDTGSYVRFTILPALVKNVQDAIWNASGQRVIGNCTREA